MGPEMIRPGMEDQMNAFASLSLAHAASKLTARHRISGPANVALLRHIEEEYARWLAMSDGHHPADAETAARIRQLRKKAGLHA